VRPDPCPSDRGGDAGRRERRTDQQSGRQRGRGGVICRSRAGPAVSRAVADPRSADPTDLRQAHQQLQADWAATLERLGEMPDGSEHQRVAGEWSAVQTLRHLVCVHDSWFRRCCLGSARPFTAIGLGPQFVPDQAEQGPDRAADPALDEVLAVRNGQAVELEQWLATVTADELSAPRAGARGLEMAAVRPREIGAPVSARGAGRRVGTPRLLRARPRPTTTMTVAWEPFVI